MLIRVYNFDENKVLYPVPSPAVSNIALSYVRTARKFWVFEARCGILDIATSVIVSESHAQL